jgi:DNA-binding beta-propeller fold protein YncE
MAFDGANVWITNMANSTMTQIRASDGKVLGYHPTGPQPVSIVFDGTRLWVANSGSNTITRFVTIC